LVVDNCLLTARVAAHHKVGEPRDASLRLTRNTFRLGDAALRLTALDNEAAADWTIPALRVEALGNLFLTRHVFEFQQKTKAVLPPGEAETCLARMVGWQGKRNVYVVDGAFLHLTRANPWVDLPPAKLPAGLAGWKQLWGETEADSAEGHVRYQGGD